MEKMHCIKSYFIANLRGCYDKTRGCTVIFLFFRKPSVAKTSRFVAGKVATNGDAADNL